MASLRDAPNPLRPYYVPPPIGLPADVGAAANATATATATIVKSKAAGGSSSSYFADLDYSDYFADASPSTVQLIKDLFDEALYKYTTILIAQPWENAKTVLQIRSHGIVQPFGRPLSVGQLSDEGSEVTYEELSDDSENDELAYFTSTAPASKSIPASRPRRQRPSPNRQASWAAAAQGGPAPHQLVLKHPDSLLEVISQLWTTEGAFGVWKASNSTFVYSFLLKTLDSWTRGLLAALLNVPDPGGISGVGASADLLNSQHPWSSVAVAVAAAAIAGVVLAPLDLVRTKLVVTPTRSPKRSVSQSLAELPSLLCPSMLVLPTILNHIVTPVVAHTTPLLLHSYVSIDPLITPTAFSLTSFLASTAELFIKLPLETVLRRGQIAVLSSPEYVKSQQLLIAGSPTSPPAPGGLDLIVEPGPYRGVAGTMWSIIYEEGESTATERPLPHGVKAKTSAARAKKRKGQGVEGLCRGWRVGMWALIGLWSAGALGGPGNKGGEF